MGSAPECTDHNPATVMAEAYVLHLEMKHGKTQKWLQLFRFNEEYHRHISKYKQKCLPGYQIYLRSGYIFKMLILKIRVIVNSDQNFTSGIW